jgi:rhodanese-related sulfurtransferase
MSQPSIDSPMSLILATYPGARRALFARYHLGGCQSCGFPDDETLASLAARSGGHDPADMLRHLREADAHDRIMMVEPATLAEWLKTSPPPLLVDTRTREEHEAVHLPGSLFMTQELQQSLFAGPPGQRIVLYDHTGRHVLDHCSWFRGHGLHETFALAGGIDRWAQEIDSSLRRYRLEISR